MEIPSKGEKNEKSNTSFYHTGAAYFFSAAQAGKGAKVFDPQALFVPDTTDVQFESQADFTNVSANAIPNSLPFNADLVNAEKSVNTGQGVYVAVLDTGLISDWPLLFASYGNPKRYPRWPSANIDYIMLSATLSANRSNARKARGG